MKPDAATPRDTNAPSSSARLALPVSLLMLVAWAVWTFAFDPAPGWVHLLLTFGVFGTIWGIVARADARPTTTPTAAPERAGVRRDQKIV